MTDDNRAISELLHLWADRTRLDQQDDILGNHDKNAIIFDVLAPMQYIGTAAYRASWDDWQPQTIGESIFDLQDLQIAASDGIGYAFGHIRCGGTKPNGESFEDHVRATFCLRKTGDGWKIFHQHISMPKS